MKRFVAVIPAVVCAFFICACSNPAGDKPEPPAPKPDNYIDITAVAAKKADFYVRMAFDLADGYLSDQSAVRKKYGKDEKYLNSLDFGSTYHDGKIYSSAFGHFNFEYWHYPDPGEPSLKSVIKGDPYYSDINSISAKKNKRDKVIGVVNGAAPAYLYKLSFANTDIGNEKFVFDVNYSSAGHGTSKGARIEIVSSFALKVIDSSGVYHSNEFAVTLDLSGKIKNVSAEYIPKPLDEFVIEHGRMTLSGIDTNVHPPRTYTIILDYANDKVENRTGNFTASDGGGYSFSANYSIDKDNAYYTIGSTQTKQYFVLWDYPL